MSSSQWATEQRRFAAALLEPQAPVPECLATLNGAAVAQRFDVYRNNVHSGLIDALLAAFPVTARLVSEASFRALAREYLRHELPQHAALHDYGAGLPAFLRSFAPAEATAYLPDVAALEHAWWQAYGAADAPALSLREISAVNGENLLTLRVQLHPATRTVQSQYPVYSIWAAHQVDGEPAPPRSWTPEAALITRADESVAVHPVSVAAYTFLGALDSGAMLEEAAASALARDPDFDLGSTLLLALEAGAIQELRP